MDSLLRFSSGVSGYRTHCSQCSGQMKSRWEKCTLPFWKEKLKCMLAFPREMKLQHVSKYWASAVVAGEHVSLTSSRQQDKHQKWIHSITALFMKEIILIRAWILTGEERPSWPHINWCENIKELEWWKSTVWVSACHTQTDYQRKKPPIHMALDTQYHWLYLYKKS